MDMNGGDERIRFRFPRDRKKIIKNQELVVEEERECR